MTHVKLALIFILASEVSSWTVNLAEIKKLVLENEINTSAVNNIDIVDKQNEVHDVTEYAKNYEYQNYEEKKMNDVILNGSDYLERLSNALSDYSEILKNCTVLQEQSSGAEAKVISGDVCETVIKNSNNIRKLTEVVFLTTSKMRTKIDTDGSDDETEDEMELLVNLAWLLDRLARLTGFEPYENKTTGLSKLPNDITTESIHNASPEILEQAETGRAVSKLPSAQVADAKTIQKRSADHPLEEVANYYLKYKSWTNNNPDEESNNESQAFDVNNDLNIKSVQKRSLRKKGINFILTESHSKNRNFEKPNAKTYTHNKIKSHVHKIKSESLKIKYKLQKKTKKEDKL